MSTLAEIEAAVDRLTTEQKRELLLYVSARLRAAGTPLPKLRKFSNEQVAGWIAEDEAEMQRFNESK